jgi:hypothetical protein
MNVAGFPIYIVMATLGLAASPHCGSSLLAEEAASTPAAQPLGFAGQGIAALVIDPKESSTLYVATRENSVFKSTDAGVSWKPANNVYADTVAIDPTNSSILYASEGTYQGKTYKSEDGGGTWRALSEISKLLAYNGLKSIVIDPSAPSTVYGVTPSTLLKSANGGKSWSLIRSTDSAFSSLVIHPKDSSTLYLGDRNGDVDKSIDGGTSWSILGVIYPEPYDVRPLVMDPTNPDVLYTRVADGIFKSTDGGQKWTDISKGLPVSGYAQHTSLAIDPSNPSVIYAGFADGVYRSSNGGESWSKLAEVPSVAHIVVDPKHPTTLYAGGEGLWVIHQD